MTWILLLSLVATCDERVAEVAREAADRQAQQNTTKAKVRPEVASDSRSLVEADAETRREIVGVNRRPVSRDQVLVEGDRMSITPTKIEGARR
jgi:hypothetical protein